MVAIPKISTEKVLFLTHISGVGKASINAFIEYLSEHNLSFGENPKEVLEIFSEVKLNRPRITVPILSAIEDAFKKSEETFSYSISNGVEIIPKWSNKYPSLFRGLPDQPVLIHCKGNVSCWESPTVAIIGTREPSDHGKKMGVRLSNHFVDSGFTIVSGLAIGCDTIGHKAAVAAKKPTVAVLAGGLHSVYPKENRPLADSIIDHGGALITELPYGKDPFKNTFVDRDRLQSGLSNGVVVIETGLKGGTLHTVKFAGEQQRLVGCMYSHYSENFQNHEKFQGNKDLVEKGKAIKLDSQAAISDFIKQISITHTAQVPEIIIKEEKGAKSLTIEIPFPDESSNP